MVALERGAAAASACPAGAACRSGTRQRRAHALAECRRERVKVTIDRPRLRPSSSARPMRIHLISPTHYLPDGSLHKTTRYWTSGTTLPYLKALTPPGHEVTFTDELMQPTSTSPGSSARPTSSASPRWARRSGAPTTSRITSARAARRSCSGGTWVTLTPEESLRHADAVVAGEAEYVWADGAGRPRGRAARAASTAPSAGTTCATCPQIDWWSLPLLKADAFRSSWLYRMYFFWPIFFSRGCPHPCEYCAVQTYYQRTYRTRPVDDVIADVRQLRGVGARRLLFLDDNPIAQPGRGEGALPPADPAAGRVGEPEHDQRGARPRAARPGGPLGGARPVDRLREPLARRASRRCRRTSTARAASRRTSPSCARAASR